MELGGEDCSDLIPHVATHCSRPFGRYNAEFIIPAIISLLVMPGMVTCIARNINLCHEAGHGHLHCKAHKRLS
jgi:hypothetical protein